MTVLGSDRGRTPSLSGLHYSTATTRATPNSRYKLNPIHNNNWLSAPHVTHILGRHHRQPTAWVTTGMHNGRMYQLCPTTGH
jgi:hypothetical protein